MRFPFKNFDRKTERPTVGYGFHNPENKFPSIPVDMSKEQYLKFLKSEAVGAKADIYNNRIRALERIIKEEKDKEQKSNKNKSGDKNFYRHDGAAHVHASSDLPVQKDKISEILEKNSKNNEKIIEEGDLFDIEKEIPQDQTRKLKSWVSESFYRRGIKDMIGKIGKGKDNLKTMPESKKISKEKIQKILHDPNSYVENDKKFEQLDDMVDELG